MSIPQRLGSVPEWPLSGGERSVVGYLIVIAFSRV
jgi:hypothetical protein